MSPKQYVKRYANRFSKTTFAIRFNLLEAFPSVFPFVFALHVMNS